jgi:hypothetical protein
VFGIKTNFTRKARLAWLVGEYKRTELHDVPTGVLYRVRAFVDITEPGHEVGTGTFDSQPQCAAQFAKMDVGREDFNVKLIQLCEDNGVYEVVEFLEDSTNDIIRFYEAQIRSADNFCGDSSDPYLLSCQSEYLFENYISLRQHLLHQRKFAFL